jgi:hypothetical protein
MFANYSLSPEPTNIFAIATRIDGDSEVDARVESDLGDLTLTGAGVWSIMFNVEGYQVDFGVTFGLTGGTYTVLHSPSECINGQNDATDLFCSGSYTVRTTDYVTLTVQGIPVVGGSPGGNLLVAYSPQI